MPAVTVASIPKIYVAAVNQAPSVCTQRWARVEAAMGLTHIRGRCSKEHHADTVHSYHSVSIRDTRNLRGIKLTLLLHAEVVH